MAGVAFCSSSSVCGATDLVEQAVAAQLVGHRDHVDRLTRGHQPTDRRVDVLVRRLVEVIDLQPELGHLADDVARQQQRAEQALLGIAGCAAGRDRRTGGRGAIARSCESSIS